VSRKIFAQKSRGSLLPRFMSSDVGEEKTEEEKAKIKAEREARKAAKEVSLVSHFYCLLQKR
jgi:hypothetical protein